ncbi:MAG: S-methyl-5'-thioinosine phosphorylase [Betaproteobacteria bacterium]|nr:S-methyl-5'-thioinosine phosphorylase [Betaproteobacteria bacterium]
MLAIIGGTGLSRLADLDITRREIVRTPFGEPSGPLTFGKVGDAEVCFLARHGYGHTLAPHEVNYRANLWAIREVGARRVVAVNSVGGIAPALGPGVIAIPDQIIDYTWGRKHTFFEGPEAPVKHADFTHPYCAVTRKLLADAANRAGIPFVDHGVYAATQGPRLETAAEIARLQRDGASMVGMTGMPEAVLARELDLPYAAIALSVNHAAGLGDSKDAIQLDELQAVLDAGMRQVLRVLGAAVALHQDNA